MNQLIDLVMEKTGISEQAARQAVEVVLEFLKDRLPGSLGEKVEGLIEGEQVDTDDLIGGLGGLLGKR